jgi:serine/threonine-protein kinase
MSLTPGHSLSFYEVLGPLGAGGMGEVYRARDTRLDREVAIKVLPEEMAGDEERLRRFEREAKTLASLNHPNVAGIHGIDQAQDTCFLAMELVPGEDLEERLKQGALPLDEALDVCRQIAEGLEAAHEAGVVHRDLKPANVRLTPEGAVKILDFGLAKPIGPKASQSGTKGAQSDSFLVTSEGMILGTPTYMSPEQARGKPVDRRTDIWAFGCVLLECLTGKRAFKGDAFGDLVVAILEHEPDLDALPARTPSHVRELIARCLVKEPRGRLRDIGEARLLLTGGGSGSSAWTPVDAGTGGPVPGSRARVVDRAGWLAALVMGLVALGLWLRSTSAEPGVLLTRTTLGLPEDDAISLSASQNSASMQISPAGDSVLYLGGARSELSVRGIDSFDSVKLAGTEGARFPAFSPDGRWVAYFIDFGIWKVAVSGGAPIQVCTTSSVGGSMRGLAWGEAEIFFPAGMGGGLQAVPVDGGELRVVTTLDSGREEVSQRWPDLLPDGRHLLVTIKTAQTTSFDDALIGVVSLETGQVQILLEGGSYARYSPTGHILYARGSTLYAVAFDPDALAIEGTPFKVVDDLAFDAGSGGAQFSVSDEGTLGYLPAFADPWLFRLAWLTPPGEVELLDLEQANVYTGAVSPAGDRIAATVMGANDSIWLYDLEESTSIRLTFTAGNDQQPIWSPDGTRIAYTNDSSGSWSLYQVASDGSTPGEELLASSAVDTPNSWSPDGSRLLFTRIAADGDEDIWVLEMDGERQAEPWLETERAESYGVFSPDGRWVAYVSDASGQLEVYVRPFAGPGATTRISRAGGTVPVWAPDGASLLYSNEEGQILEVEVTTGEDLKASVPVELFRVGKLPSVLSPAPDGLRFLTTEFNVETEERQIRVIFDWLAERPGASLR